MSNEATARPWRLEHNSRRLEIKADTGEWSSMIAQVYKSGRCNANSYRMPADANAELIVTAVNERDALLAEVGRLREALEDMLDLWKRSQKLLYNGKQRDIEGDSQVIAARTALSGKEGEGNGE